MAYYEDAKQSIAAMVSQKATSGRSRRAVGARLECQSARKLRAQVDARSLQAARTGASEEER